MSSSDERPGLNDGIDVVAVTYSPGASLDAFLDSLPRATDAPVCVVLADNGSTDGAPERAAAERPEVRLLATGGNVGYGRAANAGVAATDHEWVVVSNPDVVFAAGALDELVRVARRWPRAGAVGPLIRTASGEVYPSARDLPSLGRGIGHAVLGTVWPGNPWTRSYRREQLPVERTAGWLSGSCLLLRREAFESVGGFDPSYFMYFEDVDLGQRLAEAGWLNVYAPSAEIVHTGSHATANHKQAMFREHHRSAYRYLARRYSGWQWLPLRVVLWTGLTARARLAPPLIELVQRRSAGTRNDEENNR